MTATIISNAAPFGALTNAITAALIELNASIDRLNDAVATASSGYTGEDGSEFEDDSNFGVAADPATPGAQGKAYAYAVGQLHGAWGSFWTAAAEYVAALDNGVTQP